MPAEAILMALGLALAEPKPEPPPADAEFLEFLGRFETPAGQWPELPEALAEAQPKEPAPATPPPKVPSHDD